MSALSHDAKAVVRAAEAMTTQLRRIADALATPTVGITGDRPTTPDDGRRPKPMDPAHILGIEADTARAVAAGNLRPVQVQHADVERQNAELKQAQPLQGHAGHGSPCEQRPDGTCASPAESPLRDQIADAIGSTNLNVWAKGLRYRAADAVLAAIQPGARATATLARMADADMQRVIALYERWVKAGPPPLGASITRWWDTRLAELHAAILRPEEHEETDRCREPSVVEEITRVGAAHPDQREPAYAAVRAHIGGLGEYLPPDLVHRNAIIWRAVQAALDATPVGRCVSSHCVEGDHILPVEPAGDPS
ncbi:hypothetical protein [Streptomyces sp. NPDC004658]|uniref:hypothetical protein n=1 Tax=Streptomyces sp. NPDC004658 TaxID=3154672 RepID=UPI0033A851A7